MSRQGSFHASFIMYIFFAKIGKVASLVTINMKAGFYSFIVAKTAFNSDIGKEVAVFRSSLWTAQWIVLSVLFIIAVLANSKCILFVLVCWKCAFVVLLKKENCIIFLFFVISARWNTRRELNLKHQQRLRAGSTSQNATSQPLASNVRHVGHFERYIVVDFMRSFEQLGWARSLFIHVTTEHFLHHSNIFQHYYYATF